MWNYIRNLWRDNHGGWLLLAASVACVLLGLVWKLDLIPEITISGAPQKPFLSQTITSQNSILVAQIVAKADSAGEGGLILLFPPDSDPLQPPSFQQSFRLDESGNTTVLMVLPPGNYKAVAFLDLNGNGQLDVDGPGRPEPIVLPTATARSTTDQPLVPDIALAPQVPVLCIFEFE